MKSHRPEATLLDLLGPVEPARAQAVPAPQPEPFFSSQDARRAAALEAMGRLHALLRRHRFLFSDEKKLQRALEGVLTKAWWRFEREVALGELGIIDFLLHPEGAPTLGMEVKCKQGLSEVTRQLHRYAGSPRLHGLVLVTTRPLHNQMPDTMQGTPVRVTVLPGGLSR